MLLLLIGLWIACMLLGIGSAAFSGSGPVIFGTALKYLTPAILLYVVFLGIEAMLKPPPVPPTEEAKDRRPEKD